ncbi:putative phage antirepressor protein [Glaesserella parasuis 174]|nr:putative phage antirepressor protein [Glaesserella parasuis]EQA15102.1 putative phage antirepressor protein [Glaesserella parasuis 174]
MNTPTNGGMQSMLCIPLKKLNGWLFSINPEKDTENYSKCEPKTWGCFYK